MNISEENALPFPPSPRLSPKPMGKENVQVETRRVLEKYLQQELLKRERETGAKIDAEICQDIQPDRTINGIIHDLPATTGNVTFHRAIHETEFIEIRSEHFRVDVQSTATSKRQFIVDVKSSQSNSGSYEATQRKSGVDTTAGGSLSSSPSDGEAQRKAAKRKKSIFRRAQERLERTMRRRAEEKAEKKKFKATPFKSRSSPHRKFTNIAPLIQRMNSGSSVNEQFAQLHVSTNPSGSRVAFSERRNCKQRARTRIETTITESANGAIKDAIGIGSSMFLTPPDSVPRGNAKKRSKRDSGEMDNGSKKTGCSAFGNAFASGMKLLKKHSSSSSTCSSARLKRKIPRSSCKNSDFIATDSWPGTVGITVTPERGLEILANPNAIPCQIPAGIVHRCSGEFDADRNRLPKTEPDGPATGVVINVDPATSSSFDPQSSISPTWSSGGAQSQSRPSQTSDISIGGHNAYGQNSRSATSSQERRTSDESMMEEKYSLIAQRLAELGDSFVSKQWAQLRAERMRIDGHDDQGAVARSIGSMHLSTVEQEIVEFINSTDRQMQNGGDTRIHREIVMRLIGSNNSSQFGTILGDITGNQVASNATGWTQLAVIFHLTTAAVRVVGASTDRARQLIDYCCDYVAYKFSSWIVGRGGWSSVVEDSSSGDDEKSRCKGQ